MAPKPPVSEETIAIELIEFARLRRRGLGRKIE